MPRKKRKDADLPPAVLTARMILADSRERRENSDLYRHAKLVVERYEAGRSIANADAWLGQIMAGMDVEYME
jgi:hypothetical protein